MQNTATIKYTSHPLGQLLSPKQKMTNVGKHVGKLEKGKVRILYAIFQHLCKVWDHFEEKRKNLFYNLRKKIRKMTF